MTMYRGATLGLLTVIAMALLALVIGPSPSSTAQPELMGMQTREEKLRIACEAHPADCILMKRTRVTAESEMNAAMRIPTPEVKAAANDLEKTLRGYEDKFIATGTYGDGPS